MYESVYELIYEINESNLSEFSKKELILIIKEHIFMTKS